VNTSPPEIADGVFIEFVTRTSTGPTVIVAGDVAVMDVAELTTTPVAAVAPKLTVEPKVKKVPVIVTDVPPAVGPLFGLTEVIVAAEAEYVNWSDAPVAEVPAEFATVTSTIPAAPAGERAVMVVELTTVTLIALFAPNLTVELVTKLVPVIVTGVAPPVGPTLGDTAVTVDVTVL